MSVGTTIEVVMPEMGESVTEGTILEWHRSEGDPINVDDTIVEISTDKVDAEVPSPATGTVTKILAEEGDTVKVGQVIAEITLGEGGEVAPAPTPESNGAADSAPAATSNGAGNGAVAVPEGTSISPVAKRAAADLGVDVASVAGSGRAGRIVKDDVLAAANGGGGAPAGGTASETQLKGGAAMLAKYMDDSRSVPTATSFRNLSVGTLDARRKQLKEAGHKVSFTHIIAWAIAIAATEDMPVMANRFEDRDGKPFRLEDGQVNLGLAVDVEKKDGSRTLMVPVIRDAGRLTFRGFLDAYDVLVDKARENKLTPEDLIGGNVSLTNPGGLGTVASVPRLMEGQGTIVAAGAIGYPAGFEEAGALLGADKSMTLTSTYDHRIIQGAESGRFLGVVDNLLQGEQGFYERLFNDLGVELPPLPPKKSPSLPAAGAPAAAAGAAPSKDLLRTVQTATSLVKAHRTHGHLAAHLDPLGSTPPGYPGLDPVEIGLTEESLSEVPSDILRLFVPGESLAEALPHLRAVYCGTTGYEVEHLASHDQRMWWREAVESGRFRKPLTQDESIALLGRLTEVDALERFMHKAYLGQKQFSIEGLDMTVPMLDELVNLGAGDGAHEVVIGMAHRGRLNVLAHNLGRSYESIFAEFEGVSTLEAVTTIPQGGTGDVKYHHGSRGRRPLPDGKSIIVRLESNPSHLEFVTPVVEGAARAAQTHHDGPLPDRDLSRAMPIAIHGDAAFVGQGIVAETLNLQLLEGYKVGGTIHLIQNNQIGFTTDPTDSRSTRWASDPAKGFDVPVIHVNADDVEACIHAARLAFAFRKEFQHDVVIDLIGYRRFGHNEADEPLYTQPEMYAKIKDHRPVREIYSDELVERGVISRNDADAQAEKIWQRLSDEHAELKAAIENHSTPEQQTGEYQLDRTQSPEIETAVSKKDLVKLAEQLVKVPDGFTVNKKLAKQLEKRVTEVKEGGISWGTAEALAFGSLLNEGTPIRLTGQDAERGTFSHRHMVLHDSETGAHFAPIAHLPKAKAPIEIHNSPLSEAAALAFEYGYSQEAPQALVLWEAQFGDFANGAQVIIDQFISSGMSKWGQTTRLTLMLPHGYEGSGPEHSSARLERFLQLAAEGNMRITNPTTPAQWFHLLRRQAKIAKLRPLVVMTPKSLLRLPQAVSSPEELAEGAFQPVLADPFITDDEKVTRLILCSGKIYYDLAGSSLREAATETAIGRVELLYPFPQQSILALVERYPNLREVVWVQEEPRNMGARAHMSPRLLHILPQDLSFGYIGRPERASPGEGYPVAHAEEQNRIVRTALDQSVPVTMYPAKLPGER